VALADLYREVLLGHYRAPRNRGRIDEASFAASDENPLCGDEVSVFGRVEGDAIAEVRFEARGCVICVASASLMTEAARGMALGEARALVAAVERMVEGKGDVEGDLAALSGVKDYPGRTRCATLPWTTLAKGIEEYGRNR
jgi:nitrogen fixation NifU-like protein